MTALTALCATAAVPGRMIYHARVAPDALREGRIAMRWADSCVFEVAVPPRGADSPEYGFDAAYTLTAGDSVVASGSFSDRYPAAQAGMSLRLLREGTRSYVEAGAGGRRLSLPVGFDPAVDTVAFENRSGLKILTHTLLADSVPAPRMADFDSVEALVAEITASADPGAALWTYLDRDTDQNRAMPGGSYRLATVPDGDGGYLIVYLGGAAVGADRWQPLQIKGRLAKTVFLNHYDLEWLDAAGRPVAAEAYATLEPASRILTLAFPLLNSTLRFRMQ